MGSSTQPATLEPRIGRPPLLGLAHHRSVDLEVDDADLEAEIRTMVTGSIQFDTSVDRRRDDAT